MGSQQGVDGQDGQDPQDVTLFEEVKKQEIIMTQDI